MKHVALDYHFIRTHVQPEVLRVVHVSTEDQLVDAMTKPLPRQLSSTSRTILVSQKGHHLEGGGEDIKDQSYLH